MQVCRRGCRECSRAGCLKNMFLNSQFHNFEFARSSRSPGGVCVCVCVCCVCVCAGPSVVVEQC
jgi:hypothetical protein